MKMPSSGPEMSNPWAFNWICVLVRKAIQRTALSEGRADGRISNWEQQNNSAPVGLKMSFFYKKIANLAKKTF
jgi:hypothetical protein